MKYCVEFAKSFNYMDEIDEIFIQYKSNNKALEKFIEKFKEKRILIQLNFEDFYSYDSETWIVFNADAIDMDSIIYRDNIIDYYQMVYQEWDSE